MRTIQETHTFPLVSRVCLAACVWRGERIRALMPFTDACPGPPDTKASRTHNRQHPVRPDPSWRRTASSPVEANRSRWSMHSAMPWGGQGGVLHAAPALRLRRRRRLVAGAVGALHEGQRHGPGRRGRPGAHNEGGAGRRRGAGRRPSALAGEAQARARACAPPHPFSWRAI